jgi:hypothetical protein
MSNIDSLDHEQHVFGDIGGMIRDTFQIVSDKY